MSQVVKQKTETTTDTGKNLGSKALSIIINFGILDFSSLTAQCIHIYVYSYSTNNSSSYTNDFKRKLKEKRPELTNKVPSDLESFRRPK